MTYLTQATLDFATAARLRLRDSYDWHQAVWKAFPGRESRATRFPHAPRLASGRFSALDRFIRGAQCGPTGAHPTRKAGRRSRSRTAYFTRSRYAFQLCANPTKKVTKLASDGNAHQEWSTRAARHTRGACGLARPKRRRGRLHRR